MTLTDISRCPGLQPGDLEALERLREILRGLGRAALGYSGGVDSSFLLAVAAEILGPNLLALTASSPTLAVSELEFARAFARDRGVRHEVMPSNELELAAFTANPRDRCYHCKKLRFGLMKERARREGMVALLDGTNLDDLGDFRPGMKAAEELGVIKPLVQAGFDKARIRRLSRLLGLPGADRPAEACYATRFPPGIEITEERIGRVARAEAALHALELSVVRVRFHGELARIELGAEEFQKLLDPERRRRALEAVTAAGFELVTVDLQPYRPGGAGLGK